MTFQYEYGRPGSTDQSLHETFWRSIQLWSIAVESENVMLVSIRQPREHWVVIYVSDDGDYGEFFHSFGRPPTDDFDSYMNKHYSRWTYNLNQLQSLASNFCSL